MTTNTTSTIARGCGLLRWCLSVRASAARERCGSYAPWPEDVRELLTLEIVERCEVNELMRAALAHLAALNVLAEWPEVRS